MLYIFRIPLFSGYMLDFIQEKMQKNGMQISVDKLDGSYIFGFSLHNIKLEKPTQEIQKMEIQKISVSYNFLAPFFGKKILQEIKIQNPVFHLSGKEESELHEEKGISFLDRLKAIGDIDIFLLVANSPDLLLEDVNLVIQDKKQQFSIQNLTWKSTPFQGHISFSKIEMESFGSKQKKELSEFLVSWVLDGKKISIEKARARIPGYLHPLSIPKPILLDLGSQRISLGKFCIPLPEEGLLEGNISYDTGCQISLKHLQIGFSDILPIASLVTEKKISPVPFYTTLNLNLDFPDWDVARLKGIVLLVISENPQPKKEMLMPLPEKAEILVKTELENLKIIENLARLFYPIPENLFSGKMLNQNHIQASPNSIRYSGEIHSPGLRALYLAEKELQSDWEIVLNPTLSNIHLKKWNILFAPLDIQIQANLNKEKQTHVSFQARALAETVSCLLPQHYQDLGDASFTSDCQIVMDSPSLSPRLEDMSVSANFQINLKKLRILNHCLEDIAITSHFLMAKDTLHIKNLEMAWEKKKIFSFQGKVKLSGEAEGQIQVNLPQIQEYAKRYFPEISLPIQGDAFVQADFKGLLPWADKNWRIQAKIKSGLKKAKWNSLSFGDLAFMVRASGNEKIINFSSLEFLQNQKGLIQGKAQYISDGASQLSCTLSLPDFTETLSHFINRKNFPIQGDLSSKIALYGNIPEILAGKGWLSSKIQAKLSRGKYKGVAIPDLYANIAGKSNQKETHFSKILLDSALASLLGKAKIEYSENILSQMQGEIKAKDFSSFLPENFPMQASSLHTNFSLSVGIPRKKESPISLNTDFSLSLLEGKIQKIPYKSMAISGKLHILDTKTIWSSVNLSWDGTSVLQSQGEFCFRQGSIQSRSLFHLQEIEKYLPEISDHPLAREIKGNLRGLVELQGNLPLSGNTLKLQGKSGIRLEKGSIRNVPYQKIQIFSPFSITQEKIVISSMAMHWDTIEIFQASGQIGYRNQVATHLNLASSLNQSLEPFLATFLPKARFALQGVSFFRLQASGILDLPEKKWDMDISLEIPVIPSEKKEEWKWESKSMLLSGRKEKAGIFLKAHCYGNREKPSAQGKLECYLPKILFLQQDMTIRSLFLQTDLQEHKLQMKAGMSLGGSPLDIQAEIALENLQPKQVHIQIIGERLLVIRNMQMYSRANVNLLLEGIFEEYKAKPRLKGKLSGKIEIAECDIKVPMSLEKKAQRTPPVLGYDSEFLQMLLDIKISFPKILVKNNLLQIETKGDLNIKGDLAKPHIQGYIATESGKLFLPQGLMEIRECLVRIAPEAPLKPNFILKAATQVRDYQIFVVIQGTPENFTMEFLSTPPLPKEDILALMLTGGTRTELQQSAGKKMQETGSFILMQQFLNKIGLGAYVSAQITQEVAAITIMPPQWKGFAIQGKVEKASKVGFHFIYRIEFK